MALRCIELPEGINLYTDGNKYFKVESVDLKQGCPGCGRPDCDWECDISQVLFSDCKDSVERETMNEEHCHRLQWNAAVDGVESLILSLAVAGVNFEDAKIQDAVQTTMCSIANNYGVV